VHTHSRSQTHSHAQTHTHTHTRAHEKLCTRTYTCTPAFLGEVSQFLPTPSIPSNESQTGQTTHAHAHTHTHTQDATLLLHSCHTVVALFLHCCCTVLTILLHCSYTVVALSLHFCCPRQTEQTLTLPPPHHSPGLLYTHNTI
jgi:hypothetical protein